ncbi:XRE family transcriptional regulator, partial [Clostridioides difficile]
MHEQIQEKEIKDRIKEIREDAGLSQKDFGSKVKLSRSQISCYEKGIRDATDRS